MNSNKVDPTPIAVIGAGLGGLAAANVLAARGHKVILFERNSWLGGKAAVFEEGGYRFDMGPTILTVPSVLKKIFSEAGKNMGDYLKLVALDPQWRCFFDAEKQSGKQEQPASTLDLHANIVAMQEILRRFSPDSGTADGYREFMKLAERLNDISSRFFFWKSVGSMMDVFDLRASLSTKVLKDVMSMRLGSTVHKTVRSFIKDERVAQMIDHFTQYVGSAPDASPAVLCSIAHMQTNEGIWYPMGGTGAIPKALECLAREQGVEIRTSSKIHRLLFKAGRVVAIETDKNEQIIVKSVVSNCDSVRTYRDLIGGDVNEAFQTERRYEPACSGVVLYLGLDRQYDQLLHHNFVFSENAEEEFDYIYRVGEPAPDPTCYVCAPASTESGVAPKGGEALYVLVHTPYLRPHHHW
jgi:phytoene desaturase